MGNLQSTPSTLEHFSRRFIRSPHPADPEQTSLFLLHERLSQNKFLLRVLATNDFEDRVKTEEMICRKLALNKAEAFSRCLTPIDHYILQEDKGYCNIMSKAYILFNLTGAETLNHHLTRTRVTNSPKDRIPDETIYEGLLSLVQAVSLLKHYKHQHQNINGDTVYYCDNTFMLSDPWMVVGEQEEQYYSPEKMMEIRNEIQYQDPYISDLFSIGMVGMKATGLVDPSEFYSSVKKRVDLNAVMEKLRLVKDQKLKVLLSRLLGHVPAREQLFQELKLKRVESSTNQSELKPRKLSGKVSSVRKSFNHEDRPIAVFNHKVTTAPTHQENAIFTFGRDHHYHQPPSAPAQTLMNPPIRTYNYDQRAFVKDKGQSSTRATLVPNSPPVPMAITNIGRIEQISVSSHNSQPDISIEVSPMTYNVFKKAASSTAVTFNNKPATFASTSPLTPYSPYIKPDFPAATQINNPEKKNIPHVQISPSIRQQTKGATKLKPTETSFTSNYSENKQSELPFSRSKQIQSFRMSPIYPQSYESDHTYRNKIRDTLKQLEDKISDVINKSQGNLEMPIRKSDTESQINISLKSNEAPSESERQIIVESFIIKRGESNPLEHSSDQRMPESSEVISEEYIGNYIKNEEERLGETRNYEHLVNEYKNNLEESLNVNSSLNGDQAKKNSQEMRSEEYQDERAFNTPQRHESHTRFEEMNNHTIPEESDEDSQVGEHQNLGQFVEQVYENGGKYVGYMKDGQRDGDGIFYYRDGGYYEGRWKKNVMNGFGRLYYESGRLAYEGEWYKDEFHGRGKVYNDTPEEIPGEGFDYHDMRESESCWEYYEGQLSHDSKVGLGKIVLSNGEYYEGEFRNDQTHGWGAFHKLDGSVVRGRWEQGLLVKEG